MYNHFMDNINLPNSYPFVLGHCYLFLVKNRIFELLDRIAPKLSQKIRRAYNGIFGKKKIKARENPEK